MLPIDRYLSREPDAGALSILLTVAAVIRGFDVSDLPETMLPQFRLYIYMAICTHVPAVSSLSPNG